MITFNVIEDNNERCSIYSNKMSDYKALSVIERKFHALQYGKSGVRSHADLKCRLCPVVAAVGIFECPLQRCMHLLRVYRSH